MAPGLRRRRSTADRDAVLRERHLLLVPTVVGIDDVDGLVRCWYPDTDLAGTGTADLGGAALHGPHELSTEAAVGADVPTPWTVAYDLEAPPARSASAPVRRPDGLHRAFPEGLPEGLELAGVELLLALARRLGGGVRVAGTREVITPDIASALELRVISPTWIRPGDVLAVCAQEHPAAELSVAGDPSPGPGDAHPDGTAFDVHLGMGPAGAVVVHGAVAERPEPAVAGEDFGAGAMAVLDVAWLAPEADWRLTEDLEGVAVAARERVRGPIGSVARTLAELGGGVVVDADGFLVDRYQL